jgi:hypothetical protein
MAKNVCKLKTIIKNCIVPLCGIALSAEQYQSTKKRETAINSAAIRFRIED